MIVATNSDYELTMTGLKRIFGTLIGIAIVVTLLGACSETALPQATGKGRIDAINAMSSSPRLTFLIEERGLGTLPYKGTLGAQQFDDLSYNFNFEYLQIGEANPTRFATQFIDMMVNTDYTLVITGDITAPLVTQWERPTRDWDDADTVFEVAFAHLSPALGDVDVYLAPTGTPPVLGEERAKVSNGDHVAEVDLESEEVEITITARDDPATVLFQSAPITLSARLSYTVTIFDADPSITGSISVRVIADQGLSIEMADVNFMPTLRTIHAAFGTVNVNVFRDGDLTTPIVSDLGFGEITGDLPVPAGSVLYTYIDVDNAGVIVEEQLQTVLGGARVSAVLVGLLGTDLTVLVMNDDRRPVDTQGRMRLIHAAANLDIVDMYLVEVGTDIADSPPLLRNLNFGFFTDFGPTILGNYEIYITVPGEKTVLAGPVLLDIADRDVVETLILDTVDPMVGDIVITRF